MCRGVVLLCGYMGWVEKGQPTAFDDKEIPGLYFLDGDVVAEYVGQDWTRGQTYPLIVFPSGVECDLWESSRPREPGRGAPVRGARSAP